jgi:hypothetical protein
MIVGGRCESADITAVLTYRDTIGTAFILSPVSRPYAQTEETVEHELCYYTYTEAEVEAEVTSVEVEYEVECEAAPPHHGGYGGPEQSQVCYNTPRLVPATSTLALGLPQGERQCEQRPVALPKVHCEEVVVSGRWP